MRENAFVFTCGLNLNNLPYEVWDTHNDLKMDSIHRNHNLKEFGRAVKLTPHYLDFWLHEEYWIKQHNKIDKKIGLLALSLPLIFAVGCLLGGPFSFLGGILMGCVFNAIIYNFSKCKNIRRQLKLMRRSDYDFSYAG